MLIKQRITCSKKYMNNHGRTHRIPGPSNQTQIEEGDIKKI